MDGLAKQIAELGILIVIAAVFIFAVIYVLRTALPWAMQQFEEFARISEEFAKNSEGYKNTIDNHLATETQMVRELTRAIDRLCNHIEVRER